MPETTNIAKMAEKLSIELFDVFFWKQVGPHNHSWSCEERELHSSKTHPSDVVFYYDEPYSPERAYINCDLKSYGTGSINTNSVKSAIESLARALTCAEKSEEWRTNYIHNHVSAKIYGLLFVYNHDGEYDKDFNKHLDAIQHEKLNIPKKIKDCCSWSQGNFLAQQCSQ